MPLDLDQTTKVINLDLPADLPQDVADAIKEDVGQFLVDATLQYVGDGKSPVAGHGTFQKLSKEYAHEEKGDRRLPNLDLSGDMLNALTYKKLEDGVEVGIWNDTQARKSYGHNTGFIGHPVLEGVAPERRFIPDEGESYRTDIMRGIKRIVKEKVQNWQSGQDYSTSTDVNQPNDLRTTAEILINGPVEPSNQSLIDLFSKYLRGSNG